MGGLFEGWHPIVILLVALLVFGSDRLPEIAAQLGKSVRAFRDGVSVEEPDRPA